MVLAELTQPFNHQDVTVYRPLYAQTVATLGHRPTNVAADAAFDAALAFVGLYAVGGTAAIPLDGLLTAMLGWHVLIGVGEALITGLVVASVVAVRPDLVHGARPALRSRELEIRGGHRDEEVAA